MFSGLPFHAPSIPIYKCSWWLQDGFALLLLRLPGYIILYLSSFSSFVVFYAVFPFWLWLTAFAALPKAWAMPSKINKIRHGFNHSLRRLFEACDSQPKTFLPSSLCFFENGSVVRISSCLSYFLIAHNVVHQIRNCKRRNSAFLLYT